jgi:hypothetical protein
VGCGVTHRIFNVSSLDYHQSTWQSWGLAADAGCTGSHISVRDDRQYAAFSSSSNNPHDFLAALVGWLVLDSDHLPDIPDPAKLPHRAATHLALDLGMWLFFLLISLFGDPITPTSGQWSLPNPIGFIPEAVAEGPFMIVWGAGLLTMVSASVASLFVRYRRGKIRERLQIQWLLYAGALFVVVYGATFVLSGAGSEFDGLMNLLLLLSIITLPVAIAIAILRYRLYDIDLIIRRTLQYTVLTGMLVTVYFGSVVLLQSLVENLTGEQSPFVIVISTLGIAALFNPLRHRIQEFIDRRFYRKKYNAEQTLAHFAEVARDEVDMDKLTAVLLGVVEESMQPESVSLWLQGPGVRS